MSTPDGEEAVALARATTIGPSSVSSSPPGSGRLAGRVPRSAGRAGLRVSLRGRRDRQRSSGMGPPSSWPNGPARTLDSDAIGRIGWG